MGILHHHSEAEEDTDHLHEAMGLHPEALMAHREEAFRQEAEGTGLHLEATVLLEAAMAQ